MSPDADLDPWWREAVIYQIYPKSFADSNGDGVGDLRGIISRIDHLSALGVDAVWLCPFYPSPQRDGGYDISDYRGVDPLMGALEDFDELLEALHAVGIRLIIDIVVNHTSDEHPWFTESRSGTDSPKRDWYHWRPPRSGFAGGEPGAEPNNWGSAFGGSAWAYDPDSGEYYLHLFCEGQPDLNWENPDVRAEVHDMLRWWLERGVDGFRLDVINLIDKDPSFPDAEAPPGSRLAEGMLACKHGARLHSHLRGLRTALTQMGHPDVLLIGETPRVDVEMARLLTAPERGELDMVFGFDHCELDRERERWRSRELDLRELKACHARWQTGLANLGWNSQFSGNHDQGRAVSRYGDDGVYRARSAALVGALTHLHRGTPFVYQGEELGMTNYPFATIEDFEDVEAHTIHAEAVVGEGHPAELVMAGLRRFGRDNARTPFQWDAGPGAGFTTGTPWLAVNPNHAWLNAAAQAGEPASVFEFYRSLISLRRSVPALVAGECRVLAPTDRSVYVIERELAGVRVLCVANVSGASARWPGGVEASEWAGAELLLGNADIRPEGPGGVPTPDCDGVPAPGAMTDPLAPWEVRVLRARG